VKEILAHYRLAFDLGDVGDVIRSTSATPLVHVYVVLSRVSQELAHGVHDARLIRLRVWQNLIDFCFEGLVIDAFRS